MRFGHDIANKNKLRKCSKKYDVIEFQSKHKISTKSKARNNNFTNAKPIVECHKIREQKI